MFFFQVSHYESTLFKFNYPLIMSKLYKPRLRSFEKASNQHHITDKDRFLYKKQDHESKYRINIIGAFKFNHEAT